MYYIGVDLGQKHDYTAVAIVEKNDGWPVNQPRLYATLRPLPTKLVVRRIERIRLGTSYPQIVEHIRAITREPRLAGRSELAVDATGLGGPVVDMLRQAGLGNNVTAVTITSGDRESRGGPGHFGVPRRDLLAGVQVALENGTLRIAGGMKHASTLLEELSAMRRDEDSREHDDTVFAVALACWRANRRGLLGTQRLTGI